MKNPSWQLVQVVEEEQVWQLSGHRVLPVRIRVKKSKVVFISLVAIIICKKKGKRLIKILW